MTTAATFYKPWRPTLVWLALSALVLGGCNIVDIEITSPAQGAEVVVGEPVTIEVDITGERSPDVREVAFYQLKDDADAVLLGRDTRAPYQATWTPSAGDVGTVVLQAVATDTDAKNLGIAFSEVTVVAAPDPPPIGGTGVLGTVAGFGTPSRLAYDQDSGVVIGIGNGLTIADVSNPVRPNIAAQIDLDHQELAVAIDEGVAYVTERSQDLANHLAILDVSDPARPTLLSRTLLPGSGLPAVGIDGSLVYVGNEAGLHVVDATNPRAPQVVHTVPTPKSLWVQLEVGDDGLIISKTTDGIAWFDASNARRPVFLGSAGTEGRITMAPGGRVYVARNLGTYVLDFSDPTNVRSLGSIGFSFQLGNMEPVGDLVWTFDSAGIRVLDLSDTANPRVIEEIALLGAAVHIAAGEDTVAVFDASRALSIVGVGP